MLFKHKWFSSLLLTLIAGVVTLLFVGQIDVRILAGVFGLALIAFSYPSVAERFWQSRDLPSDTIHVPVQRITHGAEVQLLNLFDLPQIYPFIKARYALKSTDPAAPGLFLYIYLPSGLYETRSVGPETVYQHLATKLKADLGDSVDLDVITQRNLPLAFGFRFLPKNSFRYHHLSKVINIVKKDYYRENTKIRGVLQSKKRMFRMHSPEDNEWRTFQPYQEETQVLHGGAALAYDFRSHSPRTIGLNQITQIDAERVEYPEKVPFGALLTYAKKGQISLQNAPDLVDKLYIDRINVLLNGTEHRREILNTLSKALQRDVGEDDFYPLFNYGQKLHGYLEPGKSISDYVSSHGNFALYYDADKGWTILKLEPRLELRLLEAYWSQDPKVLNGPTSLTTSRATLLSGSPESLLHFQISTGTPTRGQILAADEMIEGKIKSFAQIYGFRLIRPVGTGAEGCLYLAEKNGKRFYLKSPDGQLAQEEIQTIENLKKASLIPSDIKTYPDDRIIVLPEFQDLWNDRKISGSLIFEYLKKLWEADYLCLDLTQDHVKLDRAQQKLFLIDFSGYAELSRFKKQSKEMVADRKKIEYRTPEETEKDFRDAEKFQIYLLGLLFYQMSHPNQDLPYALKTLGNGAGEYDRQLAIDLNKIEPSAWPLKDMLAYDPAHRKNFSQLQESFQTTPDEIAGFWKKMPS